MYEQAKPQDGNLILGILGGLVAAVIAAGIWAAITASTQFQIGYMAIGVGFVVAFAMRFCGRGHDVRFGYAAAVISLLGCVLGNYLAACAVVANAYHVDIFTAVYRLLPHFGEIMKNGFQVMDLVFYAIGAYFGYKYSITPLKRAAEHSP
jgi:hypothetical protein